LDITTVDMDIQGVQGIDLIAAPVPAVYNHAVLKAVPVVTFVKTRDSDKEVSKFFAVKINNPSSSEESITIHALTFA
jgi:hypothetical protein